MPLFTFNATATAYTDYQELAPVRGDGQINIPDRTIRLMAYTDDSSGSATIRLALCDNKLTTCVGVVDFTATIGTTREGIDGASGGYHCAVVSQLTGGSGTDREDLLGFQNERGYHWRIGVPSATNITLSSTPLYVFVAFDKEV